MIGVWFGEDQSANIVKDACFEGFGLCLQMLMTISTLNGEHDWEELGLRLKNEQTCTSEIRN
jgi:hypothetical protein